MKGNVKALYSAALCGVLLAGPALAQTTPPTITTPELPTGQIATYGGAILAALAVLWVLRKMIKTTNRS